MKILVTGTPRSGTTAYCDTLVQTNVVKQNFNECFNIEDLLIPRDKNTNKVLLDGCSEQFLKSLDNFDWDTAWQLRPHHDSNNVYYQDYDENMQIYNNNMQLDYLSCALEPDYLFSNCLLRWNCFFLKTS